jgi:hypothetical protein
MYKIDLKSIGQKIGIIENFFVSREMGELAYTEMRNQIVELPDNALILIEFPSEHHTNSSFIDETIAKLGEQLGREISDGGIGDKYIILTGLDHNSEYDLENVLDKKGLVFIVLNPDQSWKIIGNLATNLKETLDFVADRGQVTARDIAMEFNLKINSASNRLKRLHASQLLQRRITEAEQLQYEYAFIKVDNDPGT